MQVQGCASRRCDASTRHHSEAERGSRGRGEAKQRKGDVRTFRPALRFMLRLVYMCVVCHDVHGYSHDASGTTQMIGACALCAGASRSVVLRRGLRRWCARVDGPLPQALKLLCRNDESASMRSSVRYVAAAGPAQAQVGGGRRLSVRVRLSGQSARPSRSCLTRAQPPSGPHASCAARRASCNFD